MILGFPLRAMNLVFAATHASASRLGPTSTYTAVVVKTVNRQHHRFIDFLMKLTSNSPKFSTLVLAKRKTISSNLF